MAFMRSTVANQREDKSLREMSVSQYVLSAEEHFIQSTHGKRLER